MLNGSERIAPPEGRFSPLLVKGNVALREPESAQSVFSSLPFFMSFVPFLSFPFRLLESPAFIGVREWR
jgi:hypothetical protein